jgi:putative phosphoesterase
MKVLVMSDTHGNFQLALKACSLAGQFDAVIHLGDGYQDVELLRHALDVGIIHVAGNCDIGSNSPRELLWECEGKQLLLVHGDAYRVKSGLDRLETRAIETGADAVLFGHTHCATVTTRTGILFVNPGTLMYPSHHTSVALLEITPTSLHAKLLDIMQHS